MPWIKRSYQFDAQGNTRALSDATGTVTDTFTYDAWGNEVARTGTTKTPFQWNGRWGYYKDNDASTVQVRARPYAPNTGRFACLDPRISDSPFAGYNNSLNNPINRIDPSGELSQELAVFDPSFSELGGEAIPFGQSALARSLPPNNSTGTGGSFNWVTQWKVSDQEQNGWIVQRVVSNSRAFKCTGGAATRIQISSPNETVCRGAGYFELWKVKDGIVYSGKVFEPNPTGAADDFDYFSDVGYRERCTRGCFVQIGVAGFIPETGPNSEWLRQNFNAGTLGVKNAFALFSVCATDAIEARIEQMVTSWATAKIVNRAWDCCGSGAGACIEVGEGGAFSAGALAQGTLSTIVGSLAQIRQANAAIMNDCKLDLPGQ